jgi:hypothetical protein
MDRELFVFVEKSVWSQDEKYLSTSAEHAGNLSDARGFGWRVDVQVDAVWMRAKMCVRNILLRGSGVLYAGCQGDTDTGK